MGRRGLLGVALLGSTLLLVTGEATARVASDQSVAADCSRTSVSLTPLSDLGTARYRGFEGGLYTGGANDPPSAYRAEGLAAARLVEPRDATGHPAAGGKIVLLSIGMSNASFEFSTFQKLAVAMPTKSPQLAIVNGAEPGQTADVIDSPGAAYWSDVDSKLAADHVTPQQVQVVWLKEAIRSPSGSFPGDANTLKSDLASIVSVLGDRFPNLRIVYLSSRTYAGYAVTDLNPEPFAYDSGFAVKWLVDDHIKGHSTRPWLAWGPYLWADGTRGRLDGMTWTCDDVETDGTHPTESGRQKVAALLLKFFQAEPTAVPWFTGMAHGGKAQPKGVKIQRDVPFASVGGEQLLLDAYVPRKSARKRPAIVFIHGGGWHTGDKSEFAGEAAGIARLGWVAFSINYRLAPQNRFPAGLNDATAAVQWIRRHAKSFGVDPVKIAVVGSSAGGNLAALIATRGRGSLKKRARVAAAVTWSGPTDLLTLASEARPFVGRDVEMYLGCLPEVCPAQYARASPVTFVDRTDPPMFVANSTDEFIPLQQARTLVAALAKRHVPHQLMIVPGGRHARAYETVVWKATLKFLERYLGRLPVQDFMPPGRSGTRFPP